MNKCFSVLLCALFALVPPSACSSAGESIPALLIQRAWSNYDAGAIGDAKKLLEDALVEANTTGQKDLRAEAIAKLGWIEFVQANNERASTLLGQLSTTQLNSEDSARVNLVQSAIASSPAAKLQLLSLAGTSALEQVPREKRIALLTQYAQASLSLNDLSKASEFSRSALSLLDQAADLPASVSLLILQSRIATYAERWQERRELIVRLNTLTKRHWTELSSSSLVDVSLLISEMHCDEHDLVLAYETLARARKLVADRQGDNHAALVPLVLAQCRILIYQGRIEEARTFSDWCENYAKETPLLNAQLTLLKGYVSRAAGDERAAITFFGKLLTADRSKASERIWHQARRQSWYAVAYREPSVQLEIECRETVKSSKIREDKVMAFLCLAEQKSLAGKPLSATVLAEQACQLIDDKAETIDIDLHLDGLITLASCYSSVARYAEAEQTLSRAIKEIESTPTISNIWQAQILTVRAKAKLCNGDAQTAKNYAERALEIWHAPRFSTNATTPRPEFRQPKRGRPLLLLSIANAELNDLDQAEQYWQEATVVLSKQATLACACQCGIRLAEQSKVSTCTWLWRKTKDLTAQSSTASTNECMRDFDNALNLAIQRNKS